MHRRRSQVAYRVSQGSLVAVFVIGLGAATFLLVMFVWNRVQVTLVARELDTLQAEAQRLRDENARLQARVIRLSSYEYITTVAQEKLGLVLPPVESLEVPKEAALALQGESSEK